MDSDLELALRLQSEFDEEARQARGTKRQTSPHQERLKRRALEADDLDVARALQRQFDREAVGESDLEDFKLAQALQHEELAHQEVLSLLPAECRVTSPVKPDTSIVAEEWEDIDPTPDLHKLFLQFNEKFFWGKLSSCEVKWSPRMTLCAGVCSYQRRAGYCSIRLSVPLLKLRPRSDLVNTLLHEMIHALLFVTDRKDNHESHGPEFHEHMHRINKQAGTKITVYHTFHDEVSFYQQHWWKCNGICVHKPPFFGIVKRAMNRAPGPNDTWFADHQARCGGTFTKIKEPDSYAKKKGPKVLKNQADIREFGQPSSSKRTKM